MEPNRNNAANAEQVWNYKQGGALRTTALEWMDAKFRAVDTTNYTLDYFTGTMFQAWKDVADTYSVGLCQYEGGWGGIPNLNALTASTWNGDSLSSTDRDNFFFGYAESALFARTIRLSWQSFIYLGGVYPSQYCLVASWSSGGMWGCIHDTIFGTVTPTYDELVSFNGDTNGFRIVVSLA